MNTEHLPSASDLLAEPDKYRSFYQGQLESALHSAHGARIMLKKIEILTREDNEIKGYQQNGYPRPKARTPQVEAENESTDAVPVTRKPQVSALLGQTPNRVWSVREIGDALGLGVEKHKSLRVSLDEMAKAGTLFKTPEARYRIAQEDDQQ